MLRPALGGRVKHADPSKAALLRVQTKPARAVPLRLSRWSRHAGKGSDGEWLEQPPQRTDAQGRAELELAPGTYWVGATSAWTTVEVVTVTDVELELQRGEPFSGRVLEAGTDAPVSNALVVAAPEGDAPASEQHSTQTDGLGRFAFDGLPKGSLTLEVSGPGWARATAMAQAPGTTDVRIERSCRVDGVVVDGEGATVGGTREADPATLAGEGGRFWLELDCGGATLVARDASGRIGAAKVEAGARSVTIRLEAGASLPGTVRTSAGEAVAGAEVVARLGSDDLRARAVTDERGTFTLTPLAPGNYVITAHKGRGTTGALYGAVVPEAKSADIVVAPGASIEGEVIGGDDPIPVEVTWAGHRERPARAQTLGGRFRFDDLPIGAVTVVATVAGQTAEQHVFLTAGTTQTVQLALEGTGRITGRVTGPKAGGARVIANRHLREGELQRSTLAAADGTYAIEVPAGDYRVGASSPGHFALHFDASVHVEPGKDATLDLELTSDGGEGWGPMASVASGEVGASYENINGGVQVSWVVADSPMSAAGLAVGDLLTAIDGKPVANALDAFSRTRGNPGASVSLTYRREGVERTSTVSFAP